MDNTEFLQSYGSLSLFVPRLDLLKHLVSPSPSSANDSNFNSTTTTTTNHNANPSVDTDPDVEVDPDLDIDSEAATSQNNNNQKPNFSAAKNLAELSKFLSKSELSQKVADLVSGHGSPNNSAKAIKDTKYTKNNNSLKEKQDFERLAVFYDEELPYYIRLDIQNDPKSPHFLSDANHDSVLRFLQRFRVVVDVIITGQTTANGGGNGNGQHQHNDGRNGHDGKSGDNRAQHRYELFTTVLENSSLVYLGQLDFENDDSKTSDNSGDDKNAGSKQKIETWTAIWRIDTPITHPRIRLYKPLIVINATASYTGSTTTLEDDAAVPKLSNAISMINIKGNNDHNNKGSFSQNHVSTNSGAQNTFVPDPNATEVVVKYLDEFEAVEDTNLLGPLNSDKNLKPIRSRLAATRLLSNPRSSNSGTDNEALKSQENVNSKINNASLASQKLPDLPPETSGSHLSNNVQVASLYTALESTEPTSTLSTEARYPVYPAVNLRLRCTKATGMQDSIVAILEIDNSENSLHNVLVKSAVLDFAAGSAIRFGQMAFPLWLSPGESSSIAYHLNHPDAGLPQTRVKPMTIVIDSVPVLGSVTQEQLEAKAEQSQSNQLENSQNPSNGESSHEDDIDYRPIGPGITTKWDTIVDFGVVAPPTPGASALSTPVNIASAPGGLKKLFKVSRSSSQVSLKSNHGSMSNVLGGMPSRTAANSINNVSNAGINNNTNSTTTSPLNGLVLSFSAPSAVKVGEIFSWRVFAINKSFSNRHLTLYIQPKDSNRTGSSSIVPSSALLGFGHTSSTPVLDLSMLHRVYEDLSLHGSGTGIVSLMNDVRIGPLSSQACYETEIKMLALSPGQFTLEGLTVVDLTSGDSYDCGRLLDVIVSS